MVLWTDTATPQPPKWQAVMADLIWLWVFITLCSLGAR